VLKDTREQQGWVFEPSESCAGTEIVTLKTGDYTLRGYESVFLVERKGCTSEFAKNLTEDRFTRELERLDDYRWTFLVLEFTLESLLSYPVGSSLPRHKWKTVRARGPYLLRRLQEIQLKHKTKVCFVGDEGATFMSSLFKRVVEIGKQAR
jgi:hypothetical protein